MEKPRLELLSIQVFHPKLAPNWPGYPDLCAPFSSSSGCCLISQLNGGYSARVSLTATLCQLVVPRCWCSDKDMTWLATGQCAYSMCNASFECQASFCQTSQQISLYSHRYCGRQNGEALCILFDCTETCPEPSNMPWGSQRPIWLLCGTCWGSALNGPACSLVVPCRTS